MERPGEAGSSSGQGVTRRNKHLVFENVQEKHPGQGDQQMQRLHGSNTLLLEEQRKEGLLAEASCQQETRWKGDGTRKATEPFKKGNEIVGCLF